MEKKDFKSACTHCKKNGIDNLYYPLYECPDDSWYSHQVMIYEYACDSGHKYRVVEFL